MSTSSTAEDIRHMPDRPQQDQGVVFAAIDLLKGKVVERHEDGCQGDEQDDEVEEDAEVVNPQHVVESEAGKLRLRLVDGGGDGGKRAEGGKHSETLAAAPRRAAAPQ